MTRTGVIKIRYVEPVLVVNYFMTSINIHEPCDLSFEIMSQR